MEDTTGAQDATSGTVADLKDHLETVQTPAELAALKQAEEDGKDRATAHAAIDAKADELAGGSSDDEPNGNVTKPDVIDGAADIDQPATTLAEIPEPEKLTDTDINDVSGDGLKDEASQAQADAAEQMTINRAEASDDKRPVPDPRDHPAFGMGPGAEIS